MIIAALILAVIYAVAAQITLSAALKPSFMEELDAFSEFTEKGYGELVYTDDIVQEEARQLSETRQWLSEVQWRKLAMESDEGLKLIAAEFAQEDKSAPWVLMLHGYTGWKEELYKYAYNFYKEGYSVLLPDMKAHGESEGDLIGMGYADIPDNLKWIDYINRYYDEPPVILYGQSMGGAAVVMLTGSPELPDNVVAAVSDSAFSDAKTLFKQKLKDWTGLPSLGLFDAAGLLLKLEGGYDLSQASALKFAGKSSIPTLFIYGSEDSIIPPGDIIRLYDASSAPDKQKLVVEGAGHIQASDKAPDMYFDTVFEFLGKYL